MHIQVLCFACLDAVLQFNLRRTTSTKNICLLKAHCHNAIRYAYGKCPKPNVPLVKLAEAYLSPFPLPCLPRTCHRNNLFPPVLAIVFSTPSRLIPANPAPPPSLSRLYLLSASLKCAGVKGPLLLCFNLSCKLESSWISFHSVSARST